VLQGVSLDIAAGEVLGIVGRSGSGKSTLTKLVQRLYWPEQGRLLIDGIDTALVDAAQLRRQIGVVLQDNQLFNRSVRENIAISVPAAPIEAVIEAARLAGAHDFISELPEGYDTLVGERGYTLSGGQRQRIAIARTLLVNPPVLVLDDATSAIDVRVESAIHDALTTLLEGRTTIVIAHRLSTIALADRVVLLEDGRVAATGTHRELMATEPRYAEVLAHASELDGEPGATGGEA